MERTSAVEEAYIKLKRTQLLSREFYFSPKQIYTSLFIRGWVYQTCENDTLKHRLKILKKEEEEVVGWVRDVRIIYQANDSECWSHLSRDHTIDRRLRSEKKNSPTSDILYIH